MKKYVIIFAFMSMILCGCSNGQVNNISEKIEISKKDNVFDRKEIDEITDLESGDLISEDLFSGEIDVKAENESGEKNELETTIIPTSSSILSNKTNAWGFVRKKDNVQPEFSSQYTKVLDSYELVDLLYNAYNREEAEHYGMRRALEAEYDELYITSKDIFDKRLEALDKQIDDKALEKAKQALEEAQIEKIEQIREREKAEEELAIQLAEQILRENAQYVEADVLESAIEKINKKPVTKKKGVKSDGKKERRPKSSSKN